MLNKSKRWVYAGATLFALATTIVIAWPYFSRAIELRSCEGDVSVSVRVECIFRIVESAYMHDGIGEAMRIFSNAYVLFPDFASSGCHKYAHRMGDLAYYYGYVETQDFDTIDFPPETTACGYGFYHGFFEHLIQDHPTSEFVNETCEYMRERLSKIMPQISMTCYHGSGHGLTLAESEIQSKKAWGNMLEFAKRPVAICEAMPNATMNDKDECKEGVFNIIVEWMSLKQFGFEYDEDHPFRPCDKLGGVYVKPCYFEMSQKLDYFSNYDPVRMIDILSNASPEVKQRSFETGVAGLMQHIIANDEPYHSVLARCREISDGAYLVCLRSVVNGMFEHGEPRHEYEKVLELCASHILGDSQKDACYEYLSIRLRRFFDNDEVRRICALLPKERREFCLEPKVLPPPTL